MTTLRYKNSSSSPQARTVATKIPRSVAERMKPQGIISFRGKTADGLDTDVAPDMRCLYEFAPDDGSDARTVHCRLVLSGNEQGTTDAMQWVGLDRETYKSLLPHHTLDWLLDRPEDAVLRALVGIDDEIDSVSLSTPRLRADLSTELLPVFEMEARGAADWRMVVYAFVGRGSDALDLQGHFTWSTNQKWTAPVSVILSCGEKLLGHMQAPLAQATARSEIVVLDQRTLWSTDHAIPFYATLIAEPDAPATKPDESFPTDFVTAPAPVDARRFALAEAATSPVSMIATATMWQDGIGPFRAQIAENGLPWEGDPDSATPLRTKRAYDSNRGTGNTGEQGCFGAIAGYQALSERDAYRAQWGLRLTASARFVRGHHFLEPGSAEPFRPDWSDGRLTYSAMKFGRLDDSWRAWGLPVFGDGPFGWDVDGGASLSEQHRGQSVHGLAQLLLADPILSDELDALIACDTRSIRNRQPQLDATRAGGRQLLEWAWFWCGANKKQREEIERIIERILAACERIPTLTAGEVRTGVLTGRMEHIAISSVMTTPWQDSILVDGLWAVADLGLATNGISQRARELITPLARSVVHYGFAQHATLGPVVISYLKVNADGSPNPQEYYQLPRAGAKTAFDLVPADMVWGGIGWTWYSGAILWMARQGDAKAVALRNVLIGQIRSAADWQWLLRGRGVL